MLRRTTLVLATALGLALAHTRRGHHQRHRGRQRAPNTGGLVADTAYSDGTWIYCSGTLVSPTVVLTAAHCAEDERVRVTFSTAYQDGAPCPRDVPPRPALRPSQNDPTTSPSWSSTSQSRASPGPPAGAGSLSSLPKGQRITSVGYGAYDVVKANAAGGHDFLYDDVRNQAVGTLSATNPAWLRVSMNPSTGNGGTCYGDSGGPNFLGTSTTIAAITITGDYVCRATNVTYRVDTASARDFLDEYVALP